MTRESGSRGMLWVAVIALAIGLVTSLVTIAVFTGRLDARVKTIENSDSQRVTRVEWEQFSTDLRSRLDRIEDKLDQHMVRGSK